MTRWLIFAREIETQFSLSLFWLQVRIPNGTDSQTGKICIVAEQKLLVSK